MRNDDQERHEQRRRADGSKRRAAGRRSKIAGRERRSGVKERMPGTAIDSSKGFGRNVSARTSQMIQEFM
jgi:hypothetical protein